MEDPRIKARTQMLIARNAGNNKAEEKWAYELIKIQLSIYHQNMFGIELTRIETKDIINIVMTGELDV